MPLVAPAPTRARRGAASPEPSPPAPAAEVYPFDPLEAFAALRLILRVVRAGGRILATRPPLAGGTVVVAVDAGSLDLHEVHASAVLHLAAVSRLIDPWDEALALWMMVETRRYVDASLSRAAGFRSSDDAWGRLAVVDEAARDALHVVLHDVEDAAKGGHYKALGLCIVAALDVADAVARRDLRPPVVVEDLTGLLGGGR